MVFDDIPRILSNSSKRVLYHEYLFIFTDSFEVFTDISEVLVYLRGFPVTNSLSFFLMPNASYGIKNGTIYSKFSFWLFSYWMRVSCEFLKILLFKEIIDMLFSS